jgi:hypothetical protein
MCWILLAMAWVWIIYRGRRWMLARLRCSFWPDARVVITDHSLIKAVEDKWLLRQDVKDWLRTNCEGSWLFSAGAFTHDFYVSFTKRSDALMFAMTWGSSGQ